MKHPILLDFTLTFFFDHKKRRVNTLSILFFLPQLYKSSGYVVCLISILLHDPESLQNIQRFIKHLKYIKRMKKAIGMLLCVLLVQVSVNGQPECIFPPAEGSENIVILRVQYAATILNEEYIVLLNKGDISVDLSEWVIFDNYYENYRQLSPLERKDQRAWVHIYKIPSGFILMPGYWVRICSGRGIDDKMYLYRNLDQDWLNDGGDTLYLMDNLCNVIDEYSW